jgi:DNA-binding transcriptional ArsR family regulator
MVEASSQKFNTSIIQTDSTCADFENIVCEYIDALEEIKRIKNKNKRYCLVYRALGYQEWQIASTLQINQSTVSRHLKWLKSFFRKSA